MELLLNKKELLNLGQDISGIRIVCGDGHCWITQSGDSRDHFVRAGESFTMESSGQLVIVAMTPSRLTLSKSRGKEGNVLHRIIHSVMKGSAWAGT